MWVKHINNVEYSRHQRTTKPEEKKGGYFQKSSLSRNTRVPRGKEQLCQIHKINHFEPQCSHRYNEPLDKRGIYISVNLLSCSKYERPSIENKQGNCHQLQGSNTTFQEETDTCWPKG